MALLLVEPLEVVATVGPPELLLILVLALLLFGGAKLPKLARSLGQAQREFRTGLSENADSTSSSAHSDAGSDAVSGASDSTEDGTV